MHRGCGELVLNDYVRLLKSLPHIAKVVLFVGRDVAHLFGNAAHGFRPQVFENDGRALRHGLRRRQDVGQDLVAHVDERQRLFGHVGIDGCHDRDGVSLE